MRQFVVRSWRSALPVVSGVELTYIGELNPAKVKKQ